MFNDKDKQLQRLEEELLDEEIVSQEEYADQQEQQWFYNDLQMYNNDSTELDPEDLSDELLDEPDEPSLQGPLLAALFLIVGIFLVICWWILRLRGAI